MSEITEQRFVRLPELDEPWHRLPAIIGISLVIWCGVLAVFGLFLELSRVAPPSPAQIEAQLVDLPIGGLAGGGGGSPGAAHVSPNRSRSPKRSQRHFVSRDRIQSEPWLTTPCPRMS
jgi:hypothetical protein